MLNGHLSPQRIRLLKSRQGEQAAAGSPYVWVLLSDAELFDDRTVAVDILLDEVVEKVSSVTYHFQKTAAGMMVVLVVFEVLGKGVDTVCENGNLYLGRTGITLMRLVFINNLLFDVLLNHGFIHLSEISDKDADYLAAGLWMPFNQTVRRISHGKATVKNLSYVSIPYIFYFVNSQNRKYLNIL